MKQAFYILLKERDIFHVRYITTIVCTEEEADNYVKYLQSRVCGESEYFKAVKA